MPSTPLLGREDTLTQATERLRDGARVLSVTGYGGTGKTRFAIELFRRLDTLGLTMIEQPLGWQDVIDHARLQRELRTPLCLDETLTSLGITKQAVEIGATRWVNIKHGRVGGLTNAMQIRQYCADAGVLPAGASADGAMPSGGLSGRLQRDDAA